jgi:hypothetical protein
MLQPPRKSPFSLILLLLCGMCFVATTSGFLSTPSLVRSGSVASQRAPFLLSSELGLQKGWFSSELGLQKGWFVPGNEKEDEGENNGLVTREMLQRDLLTDPQVKRKRGKGQGYKPLDNRDHLPFSVKQITPDPYTRPEVKKQRQHKSKVKRSDLELQFMISRLTVKNDDASTLLGEFQLDKTTTSGDIIVVANKHYRVETARCQYKYAGGQRFVMCRKILEVKEITRSIQEAELKRQFELDRQSSAASPSSSGSSSSSSSTKKKGSTSDDDSSSGTNNCRE